MDFIIGESKWGWLDWTSYRGAIGLFYESTWGCILTYLIFGIICILAAIGLTMCFKWLLFGKHKKKF